MQSRSVLPVTSIVSILWLMAVVLSLSLVAIPLSAQTYKLPSDVSYDADISSTGRYVVYVEAVDSSYSVMVYDRVIGDKTRADLSSSGALANGGSSLPSISADGRYVAFLSDATNLVAGDTNGKTDVFLRDMVAGTTVRVSVSSSVAVASLKRQKQYILFGKKTAKTVKLAGASEQANDSSSAPNISTDGKFVAFVSKATNLVTGDTNGKTDVFVWERATGQVKRASVSSTGAQGSGHSLYGRTPISEDGRYVAFGSDATNLVSDDTNGFSDVFRHDMQTGATTRASLTSTGEQITLGSGSPEISDDGRYVLFSTPTSYVVPDHATGKEDVYMRDLQADETKLVSVSSLGTLGDGGSNYSVISADGRYVAFLSAATNLVASDTNGKGDVFIHDNTSGKTARVSVATDGSQGNGACWPAIRISGDGMSVVFWSEATNLVAGSIGVDNAYIRDVSADMGDGTVSISGITPPRAARIGPTALVVSGTGFVSGATVKLKRAGQSDVLGTGVTVTGGGTTLNVTIDLAGLVAGHWSLAVTNPDSTGAEALFDVVENLVLTSVWPTHFSDGGFLSTTTASGSGIVAGILARLKQSGQPDILAAGVVVGPDGKTVKFTFDLNTAKLGKWDLVATNADGGSYTLVGAVTVEHNGPTYCNVDSVTPNSGGGGPITVTIKGYGFWGGSTVVLKSATNPDIVGHDVIVNSIHEMSAIFDIPEAGGGGWYEVRVTTPFGVVGYLPDAFLVGSVAVATVTPNNGGVGSPVTIRLDGAGLDDGSTFKLVKSAVELVGHTSSMSRGVAPRGFDRIESTFELGSAETGDYDVVVTKSSGEVVTLPKAFGVQEPLPRIRVSIEGPIKARVGRSWVNTITIQNTGNVNGSGSLLIQKIPKDVTWTLPGFSGKPEMIETIDRGDTINLVIKDLTSMAAQSVRVQLKLQSEKEESVEIGAQWVGVKER